MPLDEYRGANRDNWNDRVPIHLASKSYDVAGFTNDPELISTMVRFDAPMVGDVQGKSLLHLMCHFGQDTLSWARLGASVTGVDFSPNAIDAARKLAGQIGLPVRFVESDVYDTPNALTEQFDIVYTGLGVLCWLPNIRDWANVVSHFVKPGGTFLITEIHPIAWALDQDREDGLVCLVDSYFEGHNPMRWEEETTYTDGDEKLEHPVTYEWNHGIGEIVSALVDSGLRVEQLKEYPFVFGWNGVKGMERIGDDMWRLPNGNLQVPLMYSIKATKPV